VQVGRHGVHQAMNHIEAMKQMVEALEIAAEGGGVDFYAYAKEGRQAIAEAEKQEPFGYVNRDEVVEHMGLVSCGTIYRHPAEGRLALYTHPQPKREWKWLTDEETQTCWDKAVNTIAPQYSIVRAIEAKLKEKNNV